MGEGERGRLRDETLFLQASVDGFCKHLKVTHDEALNLIGQSVTIATEARSSFLEQEELQVYKTWR